MADLMEIEPTAQKITVHGLGGKEVDVKGLSLSGLAFLVKSHPELVKLFKGGGLDLSDLDAVIDLGTDFCADFLSAGLGYAGDEKAKAMCKQLPAEDVYNIGEAILSMSFPSGPTAFFQKIQTQMNKMGLKVEPMVQSESDLKAETGAEETNPEKKPDPEEGKSSPAS